MLENEKPHIVEENEENDLKNKKHKKGLIIFIIILFVIVIGLIIGIAIINGLNPSSSEGNDCGSGTCPIDCDLISLLF